MCGQKVITSRVIMIHAREIEFNESNEDKGDSDDNNDDFIYVNLEDIAGTMICTPSMKDRRIHYVT